VEFVEVKILQSWLPNENSYLMRWVGKFSTWQFCDCDLFWYGENVTSNGIKRSRIESPGSKWWFEWLFLFTLIPGGIIQFDDCAYFSGFGGGFNHHPLMMPQVLELRFQKGEMNPTPQQSLTFERDSKNKGKDMGKVGKVCGLKGKVVQHFF